MIRHGMKRAAAGNRGGDETFATWDSNRMMSGFVLSNGDLTFSHTGSFTSIIATVGKSSGKWYWEVTMDDLSLAMNGITSQLDPQQIYPGIDEGIAYLDTRVFIGGVGAKNITLASPVTGDVVGLALDMDDGSFNFSLNGVFNTGNLDFLDGLVGTFYPSIGSNADNIITANFGASPFVHSVPSGFNAGLWGE